MTPATQTTDSQLVEAVIHATTEVLATMAQTPVTSKSVETADGYRPTGDISAVISISGQSGDGMFALSFDLAFAGQVVSRLLGIDAAALSADDRADGVGELVNMISGSVKRMLSQHSDEVYKLSLPTVIQGREHAIPGLLNNNPCLLVAFEADGQPFTLQVSFQQRP